MHSPTVVEPEAERHTPIWEDFVDIFYAPSEVFDRRRAGRFGLALLILATVMGLLFYASQFFLAEVMEAEFARAMEGQPVSPEEMAQMRQMSGIIGTVGFIVTLPIGVLVVAVVLWLVGKLFGSVATFAAAAMVATYAQAPKVLQQLAAIVQGFLIDPITSIYQVTLSPARFVDPDTTSATLAALLARADVFVIWSVVLLGIGLHVVGRVPKAQAYLAAAIVWLLGCIPILLGAFFE